MEKLAGFIVTKKNQKEKSYALLMMELTSGEKTKGLAVFDIPYLNQLFSQKEPVHHQQPLRERLQEEPKN